MKKWVAVSFCFLLHFAAHGQDSYIEVLVTDTLIVEPQEWNFLCSYKNILKPLLMPLLLADNEQAPRKAYCKKERLSNPPLTLFA